MSLAEQCRDLFAKQHEITSYTFYLQKLEETVRQLEETVKDHCNKALRFGPYDEMVIVDQDQKNYDNALGVPAYRNLFDVLTLRLANVLRRASGLGITPAWMLANDIPGSLVNAAASMTLQPGTDNPMTLVDSILANRHSMAAALLLFKEKTNLLIGGEPTPERVHNAKQYLEATAAILNSSAYIGTFANLGSFKIEKLNTIMHPYANEILRQGRFGVREEYSVSPDTVSFRVFLIDHEKNYKDVALIRHRIIPETGRTLMTIVGLPGIPNPRSYLGGDGSMVTHGPLDDDALYRLKKGIATRYNLFAVKD